MREILFKAKRKNDNKWVYGFLVKQNEYEVYICEDIDSACLVIPETICEYTGLNDKNDVKIFENDIVKSILILENNTFKENTDIVEFNREDCSFMLGKGKRHFNENLELEVIGNIFEKEVK